MNAVVYEGNGNVILTKRPVPKLVDPKDALIKVTLSTICSSDIHIKHGSVPRAVPRTILGHEFVGEVMEIGSDVHKISVGDRVAVNVETFCGDCFFCKQGFVNNCEDKNGGWALGCRIDGGQSEYCRIPYADNGLTKIPEGVSDEAALFTGDILSTGYWAAKIGDLKPAQTVVVIGAGPTGLCTMMSVRLYSPSKLIVLDNDPYRLELAKKHGLCDVAFCTKDNPSMDEIESFVKKESSGRGADVVFEVAGGKNTFEMAWRVARANANVVVVALYEEAQTLPLPDMYGKNLTFKTGGVDGSYCDEIMDLIASGKLDTGLLITHKTKLADAMHAYDIFENKKEHVIKYLLEP